MLSRLPGHDKVPTYARSGLFKSLGSFGELERRIAQLPSEKQRGDAFEVFVEAYLSTDEMVQATDVWVVGSVPGEIRKQLNLPFKDYGYDGVFRTKLGELVPYQVKFRSDRTSLPYAELATFLAISDVCDRRVVLTNSVAISSIAESRSDFQSTRGGDFDRLDTAQLAIIGAWIDGTPSTPPEREPRPHQRAALNDIASELANQDRATVVMACGTGKTLVALWAAEAAQSKRVLVLVPSLNLLRQTLHEWAKWTNWGERFRYLCVCSDPNVAKGLDEIEIRPGDVDFPVRTDPAIVAQFLDADDNDVSVVFSTYQSAPVVGEALKGRKPFDLGIFDEAHKTTGRQSTRYGFALNDKNLPIRKRLFLTATPRHYSIDKRDKDGDFAVVSMDDETIYGRVAHRLTFAKAAEQKIIVPYKVVISVVDSDMIDNAFMDQAEVSVSGDPVRAKRVAHQIALKRAVVEHDLKRLITFHSSIRAAAEFVADDSGGVGTHLPDFQLFHVSGDQPTAERDERMGGFARAKRAVITNARCLTEGVDVPSVDLVAFMNPRRSRVDIVQAVGRAMRTAGSEKTCGYVLVPLFLEMRQGETLGEALERSDFDEIAQVLNAMRENDDDLGDIIQTMAVDRGKTGAVDDSRLREKVEVLGPQIQLADLSAAINVRLIEELSVSWDQRYGQLIAYKQSQGDCNVPRFGAADLGLGVWLHTQRRLHKIGELSPDRIKRLDKLGFVWDLFIEAWERMCAELIAYKLAYGECNVPLGWKENPKLGAWVNRQRRDRRTGKLSPEQFGRLDQLGLTWEPIEAKWEEHFAALARYAHVHGDCNVPQGKTEYSGLLSWVRNLRSHYTNNVLTPAQIERLERLGFEWTPYATNWEKMFNALAAYRQQYGDCNVPNRSTSCPDLGAWSATQRYARKKDRMPLERVARLEQLGFVWDAVVAKRDENWGEMLKALDAYKMAHGDCNVPARWKPNLQLGDWCARVRIARKDEKLSVEEIRRLDELGFCWDPLSVAWEEKFSALTVFKANHGHCDVPKRWKGSPGLGMWCSNQRTAYKGAALAADRVKRLSDIGFRFVVRAEPNTT